MKGTEHRLSMERFERDPCEVLASLVADRVDNSWATHLKQHEISSIALRGLGHALEDNFVQFCITFIIRRKGI
jgi:hypothetical protein